LIIKESGFPNQRKMVTFEIKLNDVSTNWNKINTSNIKKNDISTKYVDEQKQGLFEGKKFKHN